MDLKKQAATEALQLLEGKKTIGLGAGSTIAYLVELMKDLPNASGFQFVTSSFATGQLLLKHGYNVTGIAALEELDIYFDGCDQVNHDLHALKSGGGIHTQEKLAASMAHEFVILGDITKLVETFDTKYPVVLEVLPEALRSVPSKVHQLFANVCGNYRMSERKDGPVLTQNGNMLYDLYFKDWPQLSMLNQQLKEIPGIVETSFFYNLCSKAILAGNNGVKIVERK